MSLGKSSKDKNSIYTAQSTFTAEKEPYKHTITSHWVEFTAPRGERGEKVINGEMGEKGHGKR